MNSVVHFEMPYDDRGRIARFYDQAFGWQTQALGEDMGNYVLATTTEPDEGRPKKPGAINGGFFQKNPDWPAQYPSLVIGVEDVNESMEKIRCVEPPRLTEGEAELEALLGQLTRVHESPMPSPWKPKLTGERRSKLLNTIVGFEIEITHIQGKFKLSQNRPLEDQPQVIEKLSLSNNQTDIAVAELMSEAIHAEFK